MACEILRFNFRNDLKSNGMLPLLPSIRFHSNRQKSGSIYTLVVRSNFERGGLKLNLIVLFGVISMITIIKSCCNFYLFFLSLIQSKIHIVMRVNFYTWLICLLILSFEGAVAQTTNCVPPATLTSSVSGSTTAVLNWTPAAGATYYNVQYRPLSSNPVQWLSMVSQSNTITLANLLCNTTYEWRVQSVCGNVSIGLSAFSNIATFTTGPCTQTCPTPARLSTSSITANSAQTSWSSVTGAVAYTVRYRSANAPNAAWITLTVQSNSAALNNLLCNTQYEWQVQALCSPAGTVHSASPFSSSVSFNTLACPTLCPAPSNLTATVSASGSVALHWNAVSGAVMYHIQWRPVSSLPGQWQGATSQTNSFTIANLPCNTTFEWQVQALCGTSSNQASVFVSGPQFTTPPCPIQCPTPAGLASANILQQSADLSWTASAGAVAYVVRYRPANSPNSAWQLMTVQTNSASLHNLLCNTQYEWQVQAVCSPSGTINSTSPFSSSGFFTTLACPTTCVPPTALTSNVNSNGTATLAWTAAPGAIAYVVQYRPISSANTLWTSVNTQATTLTISHLHCGVTYEWRVQSICGNHTTAVSVFSPTEHFITPPCPVICPAPTNLVSSAIGMNSAQVSWDAVSGAVFYVVRFRPVTSPTVTHAWRTVTVQTNSANLGNLFCNTMYEWTVQAICGPSNAGTINAGGPFAPVEQFTTLSCPQTNCPAPSGLASANVTSSGADLSWTSTGAYRYHVRYRIANTNLWMNASSATNSVTLSGLHPNMTYEWQVRGICAHSSAFAVMSPWSNADSFTTLMLSPVRPSGQPGGQD
ncbi:MAG: hypothetical protein DWQ39_10280 [Bacteroidetes bacterium]|nr:MAG: hypothetical protein DWQ39_10280 [Bacteroidota bacterium]